MSRRTISYRPGRLLLTLLMSSILFAGAGCGATAEAAGSTGNAGSSGSAGNAVSAVTAEEAEGSTAAVVSSGQGLSDGQESAATRDQALTDEQESAATRDQALTDGHAPASAAPAGAYSPPEYKGSYFDEEEAEGDSGVALDLSNTSQGYVGVSAYSDSRLKFQVIKGEMTYTYDISSDGEPSILPIQSGDGWYTFRVMENVADSKYAILYMTEEEVTLDDEFEPFLRPSDYANYSSDSQCVKTAAELAAKSADQNAFIGAVYDLVCKKVKYDKHKAETVQSGYLPVPDETLSTGKGICFDYASLCAAMLRSQGVPCKVIFGYVSPEDLYHAWNMIYTESEGWVTVQFKVTGDDWNRVDLTFAANGADASFIGDGSNYAEVYCY